MREFENFPNIKTCPLCGTNDDKSCVLIPVDGTDIDDGRTCEAVVVHSECLKNGGWRYNKDVGVIYKAADKGKD